MATKQKTQTSSETPSRTRPHGKQAVLDLRAADDARIEDLVFVGRYHSKAQAYVDLIVLALDAIDRDDPVTDVERARAKRVQERLGRNANGHA